MVKIQKISLFIVKISLAYILVGCMQPNLNNQKHNYENKTDLCIIPNQEWRITEVSLFVSQVHLHARKEDVFQNILSCIMDKCYIYTV